MRVTAYAEAGCPRKRTGAVAKKDRDRATEQIGCGDVELSVAIEVGNDQAFGIVASGVGCGCLKRAISDPKQDRNAIAVWIAGCEIRLAVGIEVCNDHRVGKTAYGVVHRCRERTTSFGEG